MKITIERKSFVDSLTIGSQMAGKSKTLPILDNAKITLKNGNAVISSFDGEVAITNRTPIIECDEDCVFCIEPQSLITLLKSIKDEVVSLSLENNVCTIRHNNGELSLPFLNADTFPKPVLDEDASTIEISSETVSNWLKDAKNFVHKNALYPALMCVCLYWENGELGVASTDSMSLYHDNTEIDYSGDKQVATVSSKAVDAVLAMINGNESVVISNGSRTVMFRTSNSMLVATKPEQAYPDFKRIIPTKSRIEIEASKRELIDSVKRIMIGADKGTSLIKMDASSLNIALTSEDIVNSKKALENCVCTCMGGEISIGINGLRLQTLLNTIEGDNVRFLIDDYNKPVVIKDSAKQNKILILMPCVI